VLPPPFDEQARIRGRLHQRLIDAEVRASRRAILSDFRHRLRTQPTALAGQDFLTLADETTVHLAILIAAHGIAHADACDLRLFDPVTRSWRIARQRGLAAALVEPESADPPAPGALRAAGFRATYRHPLHDGDGRLLGALYLHYRTTGPHPGQDVLARMAATALAHVSGPPAPTRL